MQPAVSTPEPAIRTRGLTKRYDDLVAVDRLDMEVARGEIFGLLGPNGAGKTTTILMLLGLTEPSEGQARVVGLDPTRQPLEVKRRVGYLPDNVGFYGDLTGRQNLRYTARLNGIPHDAATRRIEDVLAQVRLTSAGDQKAGTYSRGMRQRLGIADALLAEPDILILDEPTIALDPESLEETLTLIRDLPKERDVAVLLSSHQLHQVQEICDRVAIFVSGRVVATGRIQDLAGQVGADIQTIEVGTSQTAADSLRAIPDVVSVAPEGDLLAVRARRDVRNDVVRTLTEGNFELNHLRRKGDDLDEVYRRYFSEREVTANGDGS